MSIKRIIVLLAFIISSLVGVGLSFAACTKGLTQYRPDPADGCNTQQRVCCNSGNWSAWGGACTGADNCTSSEVWNGKECINCSNAAVKAANKAYCCPSAPQTDTVCYKDCYYWTGTTGTVDCYKAGSSSAAGVCNGTMYQGYCTGDCSGQFSNQMQGIYSACAGVSMGDECSENDYNNYTYNSLTVTPGSSLGGLGGETVPCSQYSIEETTMGYIISKMRAYHFWCAKSSTKCKNGW